MWNGSKNPKELSFAVNIFSNSLDKYSINVRSLGVNIQGIFYGFRIRIDVENLERIAMEVDALYARRRYAAGGTALILR